MKEYKRLRLVGFWFFILTAGVLVRTFQFQVISREPWSQMAPRQYQRRVKLMAHRGIIYDRNLNIMAMDLPIHSLAVDPSSIQDKQKMASFLAQQLDIDEQECLAAMEENSSRSFVYIKKDISQKQQKALKQSGRKGFVFVKERKRVRPFGDLAVQVLGIVNNSRQGVGGIEQSLNTWLQGRDGWAILQKDARNNRFSSIDYPAEQSRDGHHVVLTLDHAFQSIVEQEIKAGVEKHRAKSGTAVLMDPVNGEILAMASVTGAYSDDAPRFDQWIRNRSVQDCFEPGSIFKIITAAAGLQAGSFNTNSLIHCENGEYMLAGHKIHDHNESYSWLTLTQVLEKSSNIGIAKVGQKLGSKTLFRYVRDFGFGNRTGLDLPGEEPGILQPVYEWNDFTLATTSFGQGIAVTAVQMAAAVSAVANGGELVQPRIWKEILDSGGSAVKSSEPRMIRRVMSQANAFKLRAMLASVVEKGSGIGASVKGIDVAGKTGTAQKSIEGVNGYMPGLYVSSFVGFWPAEAPQYVLVVVLDEPRGVYWGSHTAAPVFSRMVNSLHGITVPRNTVPGHKTRRRRTSDMDFASYVPAVPAVARPEPEGAVQREIPVSRGSVHYIPDVKGYSVREALELLSEYKIKVKIRGSGVVVTQNPRPGKRVCRGMVCSLVCNNRM